MLTHSVSFVSHVFLLHRFNLSEQTSLVVPPSKLVTSLGFGFASPPHPLPGSFFFSFLFFCLSFFLWGGEGRGRRERGNPRSSLTPSGYKSLWITHEIEPLVPLELGHAHAHTSTGFAKQADDKEAMCVQGIACNCTRCCPTQALAMSFTLFFSEVMYQVAPMVDEWSSRPNKCAGRRQRCRHQE